MAEANVTYSRYKLLDDGTLLKEIKPGDWQKVEPRVDYALMDATTTVDDTADPCS